MERERGSGIWADCIFEKDTRARGCYVAAIEQGTGKLFQCRCHSPSLIFSFKISSFRRTNVPPTLSRTVTMTYSHGSPIDVYALSVINVGMAFGI